MLFEQQINQSTPLHVVQTPPHIDIVYIQVNTSETVLCFNENIKEIIYIREYGSTLYVGMARKKNGRPYISIASDELKSLVIYTDKF